MKKEHCELVFAPREYILNNVLPVVKTEKGYQNVLNNVTGTFLPNMPDDMPTLGKLGNEYHSKWYGLISNVDSLLTSITQVLINFKREYIDFAVTSSKSANEEFDHSIPEIIISFKGFEISEIDKNAVKNVAKMLLGEYNPKVV